MESTVAIHVNLWLDGFPLRTGVPGGVNSKAIPEETRDVKDGRRRCGVSEGKGRRLQAPVVFRCL
jgi:hypothetical protein